MLVTIYTLAPLTTHCLLINWFRSPAVCFCIYEMNRGDIHLSLSIITCSHLRLKSPKLISMKMTM